MDVHVSKWGNSCGIRIPKAVLQQLSIEAGQDVSLKVKDDQIIIRKKLSHPKYSYDELIEQAKHCQKPELVFDDPPQGNEIW